ncbi:hypothetical protein RMN56_27830 [Micromonospora halotolerans]|uniref:Sensor domain-containing protein n=1 Tax=Micromonospora halotolerans TaxID=709879 RepID=A0ABY9ZUH4_9ACTN|nr:hypothetical protein [Micromonospora halotolerans]WNM38898.1 hypothetical protein RMN56_27830 [Micromonospora halotolerans]
MLGYQAYAVAALPVTVLGLVCGPFGAAAVTGRIPRELARRLLRVQVGAARGADARVPLRYRLAALPFEIVSFALLAPAWAVFIARGVLYPIFGADHLAQSWGGPSLPGAWLAHFLQGPPLLLVITVVLWPVRKRQVRAAARHLSGEASHDRRRSARD